MTPEERRMLRHELRAPVGNIIGYAELLRDHLVEQPTVRQREHLDHLLQNARELLRRIDMYLAPGDGPILPKPPEHDSG